jgi:O-antigen/teichoic acid export membrane protein
MAAPESTPAASAPVAIPSVNSRVLARGVSWVWSGNLVGQTAWFGSLIVLGALLPPKAFGSVAIGMVIANAAALVQDAGSRGTIVLTRKLRATDIARAVSINLAVGLTVALAVDAGAGAIVRHFAAGGDPLVLRILVLSVAVRALAIAPMAVLQRTLQFKLQASVAATASLTAGVGSVVAALLGAGVWSLVVRQLLAATLLPVLAWIVAVQPLRAELAAAPRDRGPSRRKGATWFFLLAATDFVVLSADSVVVGHSRGAAQLGLYSLAFTLAFAPLTNFGWQIGKVLFPATARTADLDVIVRRMLKVTRLTATVLLPLLPPTIVLAPVLLPAVLGQEWKAMVVPFQILVVVGLGHSILVGLGDSLSGIGEVRWRALLHLAWAGGMVAALVGLVRVGGITGAAVAHLVLLVPFAFAYLVWGTRRIDTSVAAMLRALGAVAVPVAFQFVVTGTAYVALEHVDRLLAACIASAVGLASAGFIFVRFTPAVVDDCRGFLMAFASEARASS